jgi:hypothetical protein
MAELQFLRADRADIDAYRTQPLVDYHPGSPKNVGRMGGFYFIIFISSKKNYG